MAGIVIFGIFGIAIACVILLWIKGPQGDILGIGKYLPSWLYTANDTSAEGSDPNGDVNESSKSKNKSKKDRSGDDDKGSRNGKSESDLPSLNFDFDNPGKTTDKDGNPKEREVGPLKLEQTLRHHIDQAVDEVAVAAVKFSAEEEKVKNGKEAGDDLKFADRDHYFALANLGKVISSAKAGSLNKDLTNRIRLFVHNAVGGAAKFDAAGDKATKWIKYQKRKGRDGILLAGTVESLRLTPNIFEAGFTIAGTDEKITIVSDQKAPSPGQKLLALGVIVKDPKENLTGYKGDKEEVVWVGLAFRPRKAGDPPVELPVNEIGKSKQPDGEKPTNEKPDKKKPPVDDKKPSDDKKPPVIEEPKIEEPVVEEPKIDEPVIEEPKIDEPAIEEPAIEEPAIDEPAVEEPAKEDE